MFSLAGRQTQNLMMWGRGGGLVVSFPTFYSDDPSSNPAGYLINFLYEKMKIHEKEAGVGPFKKNITTETHPILIASLAAPLTTLTNVLAIKQSHRFLNFKQKQ